MDKKTQKIGVICSIVQIILSIICLIYNAINQENIIIWVLFLCSGILLLSSNISRNNKKEDEWGSANSNLHVPTIPQWYYTTSAPNGISNSLAIWKTAFLWFCHQYHFLKRLCKPLIIFLCALFRSPDMILMWASSGFLVKVSLHQHPVDVFVCVPPAWLVDCICAFAQCHSSNSIILWYNDISPVAEAYKLVIHLLYFSAIFSMMSTTGHASASTNICIFYPASSNKRNYLSRYLNMFIWPSHS